MKKIFILLLLVISANAIFAGERYNVKIVNPTFHRDGSSLRVNFTIETKNFNSNDRLKMTPILYNGDNQWYSLDKVIISGSKRKIYDDITRESFPNKYVVGSKSRSILYTTTIPYESWMQYVAVALEQVYENCCSQYELPIQQVSKPQLLEYSPVPYFNVAPLRYELTELEKYDIENPFLHPMEDYAKRYDILLKDRDKGCSAMIFKVGSSVLDKDDPHNKAVLESVSKALTIIKQDPNASLKNIMITGYASPEGSLLTNTRLAQARMESVKKFLDGVLGNAPKELFELYNGREDWNGLREQVDNSNMDYKEEVLKVIDSYKMEQEIRKTKLREIGGGAPYKYMLQNFYPSLRSAGYIQVYYEINRKATVATAVTDEKGRTTWIDPDSPANHAVTNINKALELLVDSKYSEALEMLKEFEDSSRSWNYLGVSYMMTGDYDNAEKYFKKAEANGDENATRNLEQIAWIKNVKENTSK